MGDILWRERAARGPAGLLLLLNVCIPNASRVGAVGQLAVQQYTHKGKGRL